MGFQMEGQRTVIIEEVDANHCRHTIEGNITVKIPMLGRVAEKSIVDSTIKTMRALPAIVDR